MHDILIVEDNVEIGNLLCTFLRKENYTVSLAASGEKAMDIYETYGAKLIILDIMLPGMDGFTFLFQNTRVFQYPYFDCQCEKSKDDKLKD